MPKPPIRYTVDRVADYDWVIFDDRRQGSPIVYLMYVVPISGQHVTHQMILTRYDAAIASLTGNTVFDTELYSVQFYATSDSLERFVDEVLWALVDNDIDVENPFELSVQFGGLVRSRKPKLPVWLESSRLTQP